MKQATWICLICIEGALALYFAISAAFAYGSILPTAAIPSAEYSSLPMPRTAAPRSTLTNSIAREGLASWYDRESCIKESGQAIMSNLQPLDDNALTCALWITNEHGKPRFPDGRLVKILNVMNGAMLTVAWTDNGPGSVQRSRGVICDLTPRAMRELAGDDGIRTGMVEVIIEGI